MIVFIACLSSQQTFITQFREPHIPLKYIQEAAKW